jgi:hypothetical protein
VFINNIENIGMLNILYEYAFLKLNCLISKKALVDPQRKQGLLLNNIEKHFGDKSIKILLLMKNNKSNKSIITLEIIYQTIFISLKNVIN